MNDSNDQDTQTPITGDLGDQIYAENFNIVDIGPECFAASDLSVISWKGENYYRMCGHVVRTIGVGGYSHCVKPRHHPNPTHEDYFGNVKDVHGQAEV